VTEVRPRPCGACPYRADVPSGVWDRAEYEKLKAYDAPTFGQPMQGFACHSTPQMFCHGWAVVHTSRGHEFDLLALRFSPCEVPEPVVPLFESGTAAAEHGQREVEAPGTDAQAAIELLERQIARRAKT
jgi:hypothetical protein